MPIASFQFSGARDAFMTRSWRVHDTLWRAHDGRLDRSTRQKLNRIKLDSIPWRCPSDQITEIQTASSTKFLFQMALNFGWFLRHVAICRLAELLKQWFIRNISAVNSTALHSRDLATLSKRIACASHPLINNCHFHQHRQLQHHSTQLGNQPIWFTTD